MSSSSAPGGKARNRVLIPFIVDAYHNTSHSGLVGETPRNAWLRLTGLYGVMPPPSPEVRRHVFGLSFEKRISNRGLLVLGLYYQSPGLQKLRADVGQKKVLIRFDRTDIGAISVLTAEGWLSVPCTFPELAGTGYWEWVAAAEDLARRNADMAALTRDIVERAVAAVREKGEMATARAELDKPILTLEEFERVEAALNKSFAFVDGAVPPDDGDILDPDEISQDDVQETSIPETPPQPRSSRRSDDDQFDDPTDWDEKE
jgi:putative transposase